jgi:hypothetical protein
MVVFLLKRRDRPALNVLVTADGREMAKRMAFPVLMGNMDEYVVTPITVQGTRTILMISAEVVQR